MAETKPKTQTTKPATKAEPAAKVPVDKRAVKDTVMMQLAGIQPDIQNAVKFEDYLKPGDVAECNAIILFKQEGIDSKDISPVRFQAPHPDQSGNYATFGFEKPGIVLMPMAGWRYFEAEILSNLSRQEKNEINFLGLDISFTKLSQEDQILIVYNLWEEPMLNAISGNQKCGHLREAVAQRYAAIKNRERVVKLEPRDTDTSKPRLSR